MRVLSLALVLLLTACGSQAPDRDTEAGIAAFASRQVTAADAAREAGDLAEALARWRTLLLVPAEAARAHTAIAALEPEIATRTREAVERGEAAYSRGNRRDGERWMLAALALSPGEQTAVARLRQEFSARAVAQARNKIDSEHTLLAAPKPAQAGEPPVPPPSLAALYREGRYRDLIARTEARPPKPGSADAGHLRAAHLQLADAASDRERELEHVHAALAAQPQAEDPLLARVVALRDALSEEWLKTGIGLLKSDLGAAITALEKSLHYNPQNRNANLRRQQARTLERNLRRIQGS